MGGTSFFNQQQKLSKRKKHVKIEFHDTNKQTKKGEKEGQMTHDIRTTLYGRG